MVDLTLFGGWFGGLDVHGIQNPMGNQKKLGSNPYPIQTTQFMLA